MAHYTSLPNETACCYFTLYEKAFFFNIYDHIKFQGSTLNEYDVSVAPTLDVRSTTMLVSSMVGNQALLRFCDLKWQTWATRIMELRFRIPLEECVRDHMFLCWRPWDRIIQHSITPTACRNNYLGFFYN